MGTQTCLAAIAAVMTTATLARADDANWAVPVGVNAGFGLHKTPNPTGAILGVEGSFVVLAFTESKYFSLPTVWGGGYVDAVWDTAAGRGRVSVGPEIGYMVFGVDGGLVTQFGGGEVRLGGCVRPMLTIGVISLYVRLTFVPSDPEVDQTTEIGILLKYPLHGKNWL
jgi:hypothetical protein